MFKAVIIRQKKEFRRPDGMRVSFEDNAVVIVDDEGVPKGTEIKGPVARKQRKRYSKISSELRYSVVRKMVSTQPRNKENPGIRRLSISDINLWVRY